MNLRFDDLFCCLLEGGLSFCGAEELLVVVVGSGSGGREEGEEWFDEIATD